MIRHPSPRAAARRRIAGSALLDISSLVVAGFAGGLALLWAGVSGVTSAGIVAVSAAAGALYGGVRGRRRREASAAHLPAGDPEAAGLGAALDRALRLDPLTGLPNRSHSLDLLESQCRRGSAFELYLFGLDRFSEINDLLGHEAGDELLRQVHGRLRAALGETASCGRLGGDEFMALVQGDPADAADERCRRASAELSAAFHLATGSAYVTTSIGMARFPGDAEDARQLLRRADLAMQSAKRRGGRAFVLFDASLQQCSERRLAMENDLRVALARGQFEIHLQPKFEVAGGALSGAEVLLRWRHPARGLVSPAEFIPLLEENGLILPVGRWVLQESTRDFARWRRHVPADFVFAVNLSPRQFQDPTLLETVRDALALHDIPGGQLELEITEGALMQDTDAALRVVADLRALGVRIAVDDFGAGYSSLNHLRLFRPETVKLDRSFIQGITDDAAAGEFVRRIVDLSLALGQTVVAEGVETDAELAELARIGCPQAQGFRFSRPLPAAEFVRRFAAGTP